MNRLTQIFLYCFKITGVFLIIFTVQARSTLFIKLDNNNVPLQIVDNVQFEVIYNTKEKGLELKVLSFGEHQIVFEDSITIKSINAIYFPRGEYVKKAKIVKSIVDYWHRFFLNNAKSNISNIVVSYSDIVRPQMICILNEPISFKNTNNALIVNYISQNLSNTSIPKHSWRICATLSLCEIKSYCTNEKFEINN